jgi:hypothetical protein
MSTLGYRDKAILEELFGMGSGYVLDFSNSSFGRFVSDVINVDVYDGIGYQEYSSKANKLRQIWADEPDNVVGTLVEALLSYFEDLQLRHEKYTEYEMKKVMEMRVVAQRLISNTANVTLPERKEETMQTLMEDISNALARNKPVLVLDRLHTFSTKLLRQICIDNGLTVTNDRGDYLPLHSLAGLLKKHYEKNPLFDSAFTITAMQNSISLFDQYNNIRNTKSYAHDNDVLGSMEANFAVRTMANLITFIDGVENYRKRAEQTTTNEESDDDFGLPF